MELVPTPVSTFEVISTYTIDDCYLKLCDIDNTLNYIFAIILLLVVIKFLWTLFNKWLFGGI